MTASDTSSPLVKAHVQNGVLVITITAETIRDMDVAYALRDQMRDAANREGVDKLAVDYQHVEFMGSVGLLAQLSLRREIPDGRIIVCGMNDRLRDVFAATRLISSEPSSKAPFEEAETVDDALRIFAG